MTYEVELTNLNTGKVIREQFVTEVCMRDDRIYLKYDRRIRPTMSGKSVLMSEYAVTNIE